MEFMSVGEAARLLDIDDSRVRQLLHSDRLRGRLLGGRWLVDTDSVQDRRRSAPERGRPLSTRNAWGLLAELSGFPDPGLSAPERSRVRMRLRALAASRADLPAARLQKLLATRADERRYRAHRGVLGAVVSDPHSVRTGVSALSGARADYVAPGRFEIYVHPRRLERTEAEFGLVRDPRGANLIVRVPPEHAWPLLESGPAEPSGARDAPTPVVAVDLLDANEDRAFLAAAKILDPFLAPFSAAPGGAP